MVDKHARKYILKRCPFCGNLDIWIRDRDVTIISCRECGAEIRSAERADAIEVWNRRIGK
jgi:Lar family restriction alleviation protein